MIKQTFWFYRIYNALFPLSRTSSTWHFLQSMIIKQKSWFDRIHNARELTFQNIKCNTSNNLPSQLRRCFRLINVTVHCSVDQCQRQHCIQMEWSVVAEAWQVNLVARRKNWPARFVHIHNYHLRLFYLKIFFASLQIPNPNFCLLLVLCHVVEHNGCNVGSPPLSTALQLFWISKFPSTTLRAPGCATRNAPWTLFVQLVKFVQLVAALNRLWASDREGRVPFVTECVTKNDDVTIVKEVASVIMSLPALPIHPLAF